MDCPSTMADDYLAGHIIEFFDWRGEGDHTARALAPCMSKVRALHLKGSNLTRRGIQFIIHGCSNIVCYIDLSECTDVDDSLLLLILKAFPNLQVLGLNDTNVSRVGVETVFQNLWRTLQNIGLNSLKIDSESIKGVQACKKLTHLSLHDCGDINDISAVKHCPDLEELYISRTQVGDMGLDQVIQSCSKLESLDLDSTNITDSTLQRLYGICYLDLSGTRITDTGLIAFSKRSPALNSIDVKGTNVTDEAILELVEHCPGIMEANFTSTLLSNRGLNFLTRLERLETIFLSDTLIEFRPVKDFIQASRTLEYISLSETPISAREVRKLRKCFPNVQIAR